MDNNQVSQEVKTNNNIKNVKSDSYFDGGLLGYIGWSILAFLVTILTLGLGAPWAACMLYSYQFNHTVYSGRRLKFEGKGGDLFLNILKWIIFSILTLGIYSWCIPVRKAKWIISNLHFEDEAFVKGDSAFYGHTIQLIGLNILSGILIIFSLGILYPFTVCMRLRWINKHAVISKKNLTFNGSGLGLIGKYILWTFLTIITLGIFALWLPIAELKWQSKHVHIKTALEKEQSFDKSWFVAILMVILGVALCYFVITKSISYDWARSNIELKVLNSVTKLQSHVGKEDDIDDVKYAMYTIIREKYSNDYISEEERDKLIKEYDLYEAKERYEKDLIDEPLDVDIYENKKNQPKSKETSEDKSYINVGGYKISYGIYTGEDSLYDIENQVSIPTHIKVVVAEDGITIDGTKNDYSISGDTISVGGIQLLKATGNNTLVILAQSCPTLTYQGK